MLFIMMGFPFFIMAQPDIPVEQWKGKTILLIGAHPDDDSKPMEMKFLLPS